MVNTINSLPSSQESLSRQAHFDRLGRNLLAEMEKNGGDASQIVKYIEQGANVAYQNKEGETALVIAAKKGNIHLINLLAPKSDRASQNTALMIAASTDNLQAVKILAENSDITSRNAALAIGVSKGNFPIAQALAEKSDLMGRNTALLLATRQGNLQMVEILAENCDATTRTKTGNTALLIAAQKGHVKIVQLLHKLGFDLNAQNEKGETALTLAQAEQHGDVVKLLQNYANAQINDGYGLKIAARRASVVEMQQLPDVNTFNHAVVVSNKNTLNRYEKALETCREYIFNSNFCPQNTPLIVAVIKEKVEELQAFIDAGVNLDAQNHYKRTALMCAVLRNNKNSTSMEITSLLIKAYSGNKNAHIDLRDKNGQTALMMAVMCGQSQNVKDLLMAGANVNVSDFQDQTPLMCILDSDNEDLINILIETDVSAHNPHGDSLLIQLIRLGKFDQANQVIKKRVGINDTNHHGDTALMIAAGFHIENVSLTKALFQAEAAINVSNKEGNTALMLALAQGNMKIVSQLLEANADVTVCNAHGESALTIALQKKQLKVAEQILKKGLAQGNGDEWKNACDREGNSALMLALTQRDMELVRQLIDSNFTVNACNIQGETAVTRAIKNKDFAIAEELIFLGANLSNQIDSKWIASTTSELNELFFDALHRNHLECAKYLFNIHHVSHIIAHNKNEKNYKNALLMVLSKPDWTGLEEMLFALVGASGSIIDAKTHSDDTALMLAVRSLTGKSAAKISIAKKVIHALLVKGAVFWKPNTVFAMLKHPMVSENNRSEIMQMIAHTKDFTGQTGWEKVVEMEDKASINELAPYQLPNHSSANDVILHT